MEFGTPFPFIRVAIARATHDVRGLRELARVSLRSPGAEITLVRLVHLPRSLRLGLMWASIDEVVACVSDAIDAYRVTEWNRRDPALSDEDRARLAEIRETIGFLHRIHPRGQDEPASAMCRLSLAMALDLLRMAERGIAFGGGTHAVADEAEQDLAADTDERDGAPPDGIPSLHALWHRAESVGYPELWPWSWWRAAQRAQENGADLGPVLRLIQADLDSMNLGDANEQPADGWRDVATITSEEWAGWRRWQWRESSSHPSVPRCSGRPWHHVKPVVGQLRGRPVLDWPEMDGEQWNEARDVTQTMLDAWPVWECNRDEYGIHILPAAGLMVGHLAGRWRPLRLPGMSTDPDTLGEIAGEDMTPEHFERVLDWQVNAGGGWVGWDHPFHNKAEGWEQFECEHDDACWRPAAFGR